MARAADAKTYLLKGIPKDVYEAAQKKAAENRPPLSMRWVFISLLEKWVGMAPPQKAREPKADTPKAPRARKVKPPTEINDEQIQIEQPRQEVDDLDLTSVF